MSYKQAFAIVALSLLAFTTVIARQESSQPKEAASSTNQEWPSVAGTLGDTRYSALTQINAQNVNTLGAAWISKSFPKGATSRVTPLVIDGLTI